MLRFGRGIVVISFFVILVSTAPAGADVSPTPSVPVYTGAARVNELASDGNNRQDVPFYLTPDGLQIVLASNRTGGLLNLYSATRPNVNSAFSAPTQTQFTLINPSGDMTGAVISPNGLELFYG